MTVLYVSIVEGQYNVRSHGRISGFLKLHETSVEDVHIHHVTVSFLGLLALRHGVLHVEVINPPTTVCIL